MDHPGSSRGYVWIINDPRRSSTIFVSSKFNLSERSRSQVRIAARLRMAYFLSYSVTASVTAIRKQRTDVAHFGARKASARLLAVTNMLAAEGQLV